jgi:hypothetical protein
MCCPTGDVCGNNCCSSTDQCLPNKTCCPKGNAVCGGTCCPDPNDTCDPNTNTCKVGCPGGGAICGATCCSAGQTCLTIVPPPFPITMCCPTGDVCGNICCPPPNICDPTTKTCKPNCTGGTTVCGQSCCGASQLCCNVAVSGGMQPQCIDPITGPLNGNPNNPWCGQSAPTQILCNNCAPSQLCVSAPGTQQSDEWFCQP